MGVHSYQTEKPVIPDKGPDGDRASFSCLPLWHAFFTRRSQKKARKQREREDPDYMTIEVIRRGVKNDRKEVNGVLKVWRVHRASWQRRAAAWKRGEDLHPHEVPGFDYDTDHRWLFIIEGPTSPRKTAVMDFRTREGREVALEWHEGRYHSCVKGCGRFIKEYDDWDENYQDFLHIREKSLDPEDLEPLKETLLKGVTKVRWVTTRVRQLPN